MLQQDNATQRHSASLTRRSRSTTRAGLGGGWAGACGRVGVDLCSLLAFPCLAIAYLRGFCHSHRPRAGTAGIPRRQDSLGTDSKPGRGEGEAQRATCGISRTNRRGPLVCGSPQHKCAPSRATAASASARATNRFSVPHPPAALPAAPARPRHTRGLTPPAR